MFKKIFAALFFGSFFGVANAADEFVMHSGGMLSSDVMITSQSGPVPAYAASAAGTATSWGKMSSMRFGDAPVKRVCPENRLSMSVKFDMIRFQLKELKWSKVEIDRLVNPVEEVLKDKRDQKEVDLDAFREQLKPIVGKYSFVGDYVSSFETAFAIQAVTGSTMSRCQSAQYQ